MNYRKIIFMLGFALAVFGFMVFAANAQETNTECHPLKMTEVLNTQSTLLRNGYLLISDKKAVGIAYEKAKEIIEGEYPIPKGTPDMLLIVKYPSAFGVTFWDTNKCYMETATVWFPSRMYTNVLNSIGLNAKGEPLGDPA